MPKARVLPEPVGRASADVAAGEDVGNRGGLDRERRGDAAAVERVDEVGGYAEI